MEEALKEMGGRAVLVDPPRSRMPGIRRQRLEVLLYD